MEVEMNNQSEVKKHIDNVIERTFKALLFIYDKCANGNKGKIPEELKSRIIFPKYRNGQLRISEQELRFVFIEHLNLEIKGGWNVFYSVETPTMDKYLFTDKKKPCISQKGKSANFDLVIHDNKYNRIALLEFKANNTSKRDHLKDFVKLNNNVENNNGSVFTCFIEIVRYGNNKTKDSLKAKIGPCDCFECLSLENRKVIKDWEWEDIDKVYNDKISQK